MAQKIRWGILSTGRIAHTFTKGLKELPDEAEITAVGSRTQETADAFGNEYGIPNRHSSYEALASDPEVDVVYIGTPHSFHYDNAVLCLNAGKAVLCEKAFTITSREADELIKLARSKRLFLMEAMWVRYLPGATKVRALIAGGAIGEPRMIHAHLGFWTDMTPENRLTRMLNPALGGGGMLDVGIYPMSYVSMLFGTPTRVTGFAHIGETNVDEQASVVYGYDDARMAAVSFGVRTRSQGGAFIAGSKGTLTIEPSFLNPKTVVLSEAGKDAVTFDVACTGNPYRFEAQEVMRCMREGKTESALMPLDESLAIMRTMDDLRMQWGLTYPNDARWA
jgi:predicted dehydrogenase